MAIEYADTIIVTLDSLRKVQRAQRVTYDSGIVSPNESKLIEALGPVASILGLVFIKSTPAGLAAGVISLFSTMLLPSDKSILKAQVYEGYWQLGYMIDFMEDNPKYDKIEILLPFIEYTVNSGPLRFITGRGVIKKAHTSAGWIVLE